MEVDREVVTKKEEVGWRVPWIPALVAFVPNASTRMEGRVATSTRILAQVKEETIIKVCF